MNDKFNSKIEKWNKFWFDPTSPTPMGLFRIALGLVVLQCLLIHLWPDWYLYFSDHSIIPIDSMITHYWVNGTDHYFDLMLLLPPGDQPKIIFFWVVVVAAVFMTLGLFTRTSTTIVFLGLLSLDSHFQLNQNAGDNFVRIACLLTAFSQAGKAFSLDNLIKSLREDWRVTGFRPPLSAPWAQRMFMVQLAVVYYHTWICKMMGERWNDGTAVYYATRYDDIIRFPVPFLFDNLLVCQILTWGTLVIEFALFTLIWVKPLRYWVILAGLSLHLGIEYSMNLPMFEWMFIFSYLTFIYPEDLTRVMDRIKAFLVEKYGPPTPVLFDGDCVFCVRAVGFLHRLDIFGRIEFLDFKDSEVCEKLNVPIDRAEKEMLFKGDKGWVGGFEAFRSMALRLPGFWLAVPFLWIPGVSLVGQAVYSLIAANRKAILGGTCDERVCVTSHTQDAGS